MARKRDDECCNLSCMKVLYMFFNVILMLTGIGIMGVGIWIFTFKNNFNSLLGSDNYIIVPGLMIAAGFLVVFVCIVGCVAVIKENRFTLVSVSKMERNTATYFTFKGSLGCLPKYPFRLSFYDLTFLDPTAFLQ
ncbi:CD151 antigen [Exaiptasia diaphana]|nr:CD151 antigen [Exaiptasia diaphana]